jgi:hypothetical protein
MERVWGMTDKKIGEENHLPETGSVLGQEGDQTDGVSPASEGSRRRFLKGAAVGSVLFSISGRPAWGSSCTPSALASANASGQHDYSTCASKSAGYWKTHLDQWPIPHDQKFHGVFSGGRYGDLTLGEVINLQGNDTVYNNEHNIGMHAVGALVNAHQFPLGSEFGEFGYTPDQVVAIYNNVDAARAATFFECVNNQFDDDSDPMDPVCAPPDSWDVFL